MAMHTGQSASIWMQAAVPSYAKLAEDISVDVCIVGAGIAGMTTAYLLARDGKLADLCRQTVAELAAILLSIGFGEQDTQHQDVIVLAENSIQSTLNAKAHPKGLTAKTGEF